MPNSSDAVPCHYFVWGYLKTKLIKDKSQENQRQLKKSFRLSLLPCLRKLLSHGPRDVDKCIIIVVVILNISSKYL